MPLKDQTRAGNAEAANANEAEGSRIGHHPEIEEQVPPPPPPDTEQVVMEEVNSDEAAHAPEGLHARKCARGAEGASAGKYIFDCNLYSSDSIITKAHEPAKQHGGHLLRGMTLPNDKVVMAALTLSRLALSLWPPYLW